MSAKSTAKGGNGVDSSAHTETLDTTIGWNSSAITLTNSDVSKVNGTASPVTVSNNWNATLITTTTALVQKTNGFAAQGSHSNGWGI